MLDGIDPVALQATTADPGQAEVLQAIRAMVEVRLRRAGAESRLHDAIDSMQSAGVRDDAIAPFRRAVAAPATSPGVGALVRESSNSGFQSFGCGRTRFGGIRASIGCARDG